MFIVLKVTLASGVTNRAVLIYETVTNLRSCHRLPPYILYLCHPSLHISASTIYDAAATACLLSLLYKRMKMQRKSRCSCHRLPPYIFLYLCHISLLIAATARLLSLLQDLVFCRVVVLPGEIYAAAIFTLQEDIKDATQIKMQLPPTGSCLYLQDGNLHQLTINSQSI